VCGLIRRKAIVMSLYQHGPRREHSALSRRQLLCKCGMGMGALAMASLLQQAGLAAERSASPSAPGPINPFAPKSPQFPGRAKRVIHLFMNGGPSHVDTFDPKPALDRYAGQTLPMDYLPT